MNSPPAGRRCPKKVEDTQGERVGYLGYLPTPPMLKVLRFLYYWEGSKIPNSPFLGFFHLGWASSTCASRDGWPSRGRRGRSVRREAKRAVSVLFLVLVVDFSSKVVVFGVFQGCLGLIC